MKTIYILKYKRKLESDGIIENLNLMFLNKILYNYQYNGVQGSHFTGWGVMKEVWHEFI